MVANQPTRCTTSSGLQPRTERAARAARAALDLGTPHLLGACAAQQGFDLGRARGLAGDENAEVVVREARIVGDGPQTPGGEQRVERDAKNRRERAEQD